jgi:hypothetical protein
LVGFNLLIRLTAIAEVPAVGVFVLILSKEHWKCVLNLAKYYALGSATFFQGVHIFTPHADVPDEIERDFPRLRDRGGSLPRVVAARLPPWVQSLLTI